MIAVSGYKTDCVDNYPVRIEFDGSIGYSSAR